MSAETKRRRRMREWFSSREVVGQPDGSVPLSRS